MDYRHVLLFGQIQYAVFITPYSTYFVILGHRKRSKIKERQHRSRMKIFQIILHVKA